MHSLATSVTFPMSVTFLWRKVDIQFISWKAVNTSMLSYAIDNSFSFFLITIVVDRNIPY